MARPPCMAGDGNDAVFIGTFLSDGSSVALCESCMVSWAAGLLQVMTGVDPAPFIAAISEDPTEGLTTHEKIAAGEAATNPPKGLKDPRSGKSGRTPAASPDPGMEIAPNAEGKTPTTDDDTPAA